MTDDLLVDERAVDIAIDLLMPSVVLRIRCLDDIFRGDNSVSEIFCLGLGIMLSRGDARGELFIYLVSYLLYRGDC